MKVFISLQIRDNILEAIGIGYSEEDALKEVDKNLPHKAFDVMRHTRIMKEDIELWLSENGLTAVEIKDITQELYKKILEILNTLENKDVSQELQVDR